MKNKLEKLRDEFLEGLAEIKDLSALRELELKYISRKGKLSGLLSELKEISVDLRREAGEAANIVKREMTEKYNEVRAALEKKADGGVVDPTVPGEKFESGQLHPLTLVRRELEDFFATLGFTVLDGPELESEFYNFESLNVPPHHPARDMQDTFYVDIKNKQGEYDLTMRTQTSNTQVRAMQKYGAPLKAIMPGRVFRSEATDARHEHTFYQLEGVVIDKNINFGHMKNILEAVGKKLYGPDTQLRMRPKFYPFVEPGSNGEYTCFLCQGKGCRVCKQTGWLEIVGCGLIHPNVMRAGGIDPEVYSGFAFGFGLNRLVMLKYGIDDIRLFNGGDLRFLKQF
ncbi:phenylalanine--tRNA ligase subunit alpha [Candidatus Falkowbacteria bacterium HGW-Falkowbacteria-2]|uniref:Phenylalanine--tRNA ligase alpha subunit n=1 Tax=Candidatus Falkowbacteria bacterium HGW-Falkowbacteria-2 TaxID=2013769 RepID=A0A2N2E0V3_9BACT|nr:MAG: phenylalanine--tRNA ligase subunit alpha [Candidatus Falkowbacteria bacterium HGW-Falkowbacteria-2]